MLTIIAPHGRRETFRFHDTMLVEEAAAAGARLLGLDPLDWGLRLNGRLLQGRLPLWQAGPQEGDRLELARRGR